MSGWNPPPGGQPYGGDPGGQPGHAHQGYGTPPPAPRRSTTGRVIGLLAGGFVLIILVVTGIVVSNGSHKEYSISTPPTAAGHTLDTSGNSTVALIAARQKAAVRAVGGVRIDTMVSGFYRAPAATAYLPKGVVFVGGTGKIDDPATFLDGRRSTLTSSSGVSDTDPGGEGKGSCINATTSTTCMWVTHTSFGVVTPTEPTSVPETATLMRRMRGDVEREQ